MAEIVEGQAKEEPKGKEPVAPVVEEKETPSEPEYTETEKRALDQGWKPKKDWDGDPEEHRSAREYLDRGELLTKIKGQSQELHKIKEIVGSLSEHNKQVYLAGYKRAIEELRAQRAAAIEAGDGKTLAVIEDRLDRTKDELHKAESYRPAPQAPTPTPEFQNFVAKNDWYSNTASMRHWAHGMAIEFAKVNPDASEADVYKFIEREVRKEFPAKFNRGGPPSPDGDGRHAEGRTTKGSGGFEKLMATLPEDQARVAKDMVKRGILTKEKYVQDYEDIAKGR